MPVQPNVTGELTVLPLEGAVSAIVPPPQVRAATAVNEKMTDFWLGQPAYSVSTYQETIPGGTISVSDVSVVSSSSVNAGGTVGRLHEHRRRGRAGRR